MYDKGFVSRVCKRTLKTQKFKKKNKNQANQKMSKGCEKTFHQRGYTNDKQAQEKMFHIFSYQGNAN